MKHELLFSVFSDSRAGDCAGTDKEYRQKVRSLSYNLRDATNPELRARVLQGEVPPDRLVQMTPAEMASKVSAHHFHQLSKSAAAKQCSIAYAPFGCLSSSRVRRLLTPLVLACTGAESLRL